MSASRESMKKTKLGQALISGLKEAVEAKQIKPKKQQSLKTWIVPRLRRLSYQWPPRNEAKKLARVERGKYKCAKCNNIFGPKEIVVDHILPVVPVDEGFTNIGHFVESLFCDINNLQCLCNSCHDLKTENEDILREKNKKS
jgi:5-methylcytosine-specific restriction endonuclease McrA